MNERTGRMLYVPFPYDSRANDLRYVLLGVEVKALCDQLGIEIETIKWEMEYYDTHRCFKDTQRQVDNAVMLTFETEKDAVAFRLAAPSNRYFVDYEDF